MIFNKCMPEMKKVQLAMREKLTAEGKVDWKGACVDVKLEEVLAKAKKQKDKKKMKGRRSHV